MCEQIPEPIGSLNEMKRCSVLPSVSKSLSAIPCGRPTADTTIKGVALECRSVLTWLPALAATARLGSITSGSMTHTATRSVSHTAISDASQPVAPGDNRRRRGNLPARSSRHRVERDNPVIRRHSGSRIIASFRASKVLVSSRMMIERAARPPRRFGLGKVDTVSIMIR